MRKIGYARVSLVEQSLARQVEALTAAGCNPIFCDQISGSKKDRPELNKMLAQLQPGDCVVVTKIDRFGRSIVDILNRVEWMKQRNINFKSLVDNFDTDTPNGRLLLNLLASIAEYERELIRERTKDAIKSAQRRGVVVGRPIGKDQAKISQFRILHRQGKGQSAIMAELGIRKSRYYQLLRDNVQTNF